MTGNRKAVIALIVIMLSLSGCKDNQTLADEMEGAIVEATPQKEENAKPDIPWVNAYIELLNGSDFEYDNYTLVYVDEDDIPELVGCSPYEYQISTYLNDKAVLCYENMDRGTHSRRWFYLPKQNRIVSTCTGDGGIGTYEEYYTLENGDLKYGMSIGKIPQFDDQGNLLYDDAENYIWSYVKDEEEITEEMWKYMTMTNEGYINFHEIEYCSKEEMVHELQNYNQERNAAENGKVESLLWSYYKNYALYGDENSEILGIQTNLIGNVSLLMADGCYEELSESLVEENETNRINGKPVDGVRKVNVHRADKKLLSLLKVSYDDCGEVNYISHTYDTASGRELELTDLVEDMDIFRGLVEEQLQEKIIQEDKSEVWTAGYEGLTIYIQTEKSKAVPVMISYKKYPDLFKEDMSQELPGFIAGFDLYSDLIFDVDEDGESDLIRMELQESSEIVVWVGDQSVSCQQKVYKDGDDRFVGGYFVKNNDGKKYILVYTNTGLDYCNSYSVIRLEETEPVYVGDDIFNFDMAHALTDPAKIMEQTESQIQTEGIVYDTCWAHVNSEGYLEPDKEIYYCGEIYTVSKPVRGKQVDADGTIQDNIIEIPKGEMVLLFRTDYQEYKDFILADGRICRVNLSESEAASY